MLKTEFICNDCVQSARFNDLTLQRRRELLRGRDPKLCGAKKRIYIVLLNCIIINIYA